MNFEKFIEKWWRKYIYDKYGSSEDNDMEEKVQ